MGLSGGRLLANDPSRIGPFTTIGRLGGGGEARVYVASAPHTGRVAVKVRRADGPNRSTTCADEFELARRVDPAVTARPIEHGVSPCGAYLVTELLEGFAPVRPTTGPAALWALAGAAAEAVAAVHGTGIVHCDVKPGNVLARGRTVRLIDFGIARDVRDQIIGADLVHCSRSWAAPEQLERAPLTTAVDVFSWGCLVAYLATGVSPYASETEQEWVLRVRCAIPDVGALPRRLGAIVRAALRREPTRRPSAAEIAADCARGLDALTAVRSGAGRHLVPAPMAA